MERLPPAVVAALYVEHGAELRNFLIGTLRNAELADEVLQRAFARCLDVGHTAQRETLKGWLFRVAFHEAMGLKRRDQVAARANQRLAWTPKPDAPAAEEQAVRWETVESVRAALATLPPEPADVVRLRIYEQKTFAVIAEERGLPLGTVLTRMRLAMGKLRRQLQGERE